MRLEPVKTLSAIILEDLRIGGSPFLVRNPLPSSSRSWTEGLFPYGQNIHAARL